MDGKSKAAPELTGRTEEEQATINCRAGKAVVEKWFLQMTWREAYQKLKGVESILETLQENGIDTVEYAMESVRLAGSISTYLCKDGEYEQNGQTVRTASSISGRSERR